MVVGAWYASLAEITKMTSLFTSAALTTDLCTAGWRPAACTRSLRRRAESRPDCAASAYVRGRPGDGTRAPVLLVGGSLVRRTPGRPVGGPTRGPPVSPTRTRAGPIPSEIGKLTKLFALRLNNNKLEGASSCLASRTVEPVQQIGSFFFHNLPARAQARPPRRSET